MLASEVRICSIPSAPDSDQVIPPCFILAPITFLFIKAQIEELSEKETLLRAQQWALEDQITEQQKQNYDAGIIADQLTEFVQNFPQLQPGER